MNLKIVKQSTNYIPTRYDDITKEIMEERMKAAVREYKKCVELPSDVKSYKLGDVIGEKLNKIV